MSQEQRIEYIVKVDVEGFEKQINKLMTRRARLAGVFFRIGSRILGQKIVVDYTIERADV